MRADDDIIDTIAEALTPWERRTDGSHCELQAREAIEALRSAGYEIVKLPEPDEIPQDDGYEHCVGMWDTTLGHGVSNIAAWSDDHTVTEDSVFYTPDQARRYAGAFLAAADAAEADQ